MTNTPASKALSLSEQAASAASWTEVLAVVKAQCAPKATEAEFALLVYQAKKTGLDPLAKQIHMVSRYDSETGGMKSVIQVGIDGFRVIAQKSKKYRGQTPVLFCGKDGVWRDVWLEKDPPAAAKVGVVHADFAEPLFAVARYEAYVQRKKDGTPNSMWAKMPDGQLAKCAEALAMRKAFPQDLSGLYANEELDHLDGDKPEPASVAKSAASVYTQTVEAEEVKPAFAEAPKATPAPPPPPPPKVEPKPEPPKSEPPKAEGKTTADEFASKLDETTNFEALKITWGEICKANVRGEFTEDELSFLVRVKDSQKKRLEKLSQPKGLAEVASLDDLRNVILEGGDPDLAYKAFVRVCKDNDLILEAFAIVENSKKK